jgi:AraC-like DNA-binding protein
MQATAYRLHDVTALLDDPRLNVSPKPQRHPFYELVYVIRGQYRVETLGATWHGGTGWLYCYRAGQAHRAGFTSAKPEAILVQWTEPAASRAVYPHAYYDTSRRWRHLLTWLLDLYTSGDRQAAGQLLPVLLHELGRAGKHTQSLLPAVDVYLADHLAQPIRVSAMAAALGLSRSHFSRNFQKLAGRSPQQHVLRHRLEQARALLADRSLRVVDVAQRCGFSSAAHFSRAFRQAYGVSPSRRPHSG